LRVSRAAAARYHIWRGWPSSKPVGRYLCRAALFQAAPVGGVPTVIVPSRSGSAVCAASAPARGPQGAFLPTFPGWNLPGWANKIRTGRHDPENGDGVRRKPPKRATRLQPRAKEHHVQRARSQQNEHQCDLQPVAGKFENRPHDLRMMERVRARVSDDIFGFGASGFRTRLRVDSLEPEREKAPEGA